MFCNKILCQVQTKGNLLEVIFAKYQLEIIGLSLLTSINLFANCIFTINSISYCSRMKAATKFRTKFMNRCQEVKQNWAGRKSFGFLQNVLPLVPKFYFWQGDCVLSSAFIYFDFSNFS